MSRSDRDHHTDWIHSRAQAAGRVAVVAKSRTAAEAGVSVLRDGGNAFDAAVAALLASGVAQPYSTSVGGGGVAVGVRQSGAVVGADFRYVAPAKVWPSHEQKTPGVKGALGFALPGGGPFEHGYASVAVPGSVAGIDYLASRGRLKLPALVSPAVMAARTGVDANYYDTVMDALLMRDAPRDGPIRSLLKDGLRPYLPTLLEPAEVRRQDALADFLEALSAAPLDFYEGTIADSLSSELSRGGSTIDESDLAGFRVRSPDASLELEYNRHRLLLAPHPSPVLLMLGSFERLGLRRHELGSSEWLLGWLAVLQACRSLETDLLDDEWYHLAESDAAVVEAAIELASDRAVSLLDKRRPPSTSFRDRIEASSKRRWRGGSTVGICVVDADGNAVALTDTILSYFGSLEMSRHGFVYNNGLFGFALDGEINRPLCGAAPVSNMSPVVVLDRQQRPRLVVSGSGGRAISAAVAQVVSNVLDYGLGLQDAIDAPRVDFLDQAVVDHRLGAVAAKALTGTEHLVAREDLTSGHFANVVGLEVDSKSRVRCGVNPHHPSHGIAFNP